MAYCCARPEAYCLMTDRPIRQFIPQKARFTDFNYLRRTGLAKLQLVHCHRPVAEDYFSTKKQFRSKTVYFNNFVHSTRYDSAFIQH